jgi:phosphate transport system permease protein
VSTKVVVPAALSGIAAAFILGISRAIGETMIVTMAAGLQPNITLNPFEYVETMTAYIASSAGGDIATGTIVYKAIFAVGLLLFLITFVMNMVGVRLVRKYREVYE